MPQDRIRTAIHAEFEAGSVAGKGRIRNVNDGGLFLGTPALPEEGEVATLSFRAPSGAAVEVSGLVWWTTAEGGHHANPGFGLRLLDAPDAYLDLLDDLRRPASRR